MIEREFAMRTVQEILDHENPGRLLVTGAEEHELVWIVSFQSAEFVRSGDYRDFFVGHGPYVVDRVDGSVHAVGSAAALNREWEHDYRTRIRRLPVRTAVDALHEELCATLAVHGRIPAIRLLRTRVPALSPTQAATYTTALHSGPPPPLSQPSPPKHSSRNRIPSIAYGQSARRARRPGRHSPPTTLLSPGSSDPSRFTCPGGRPPPGPPLHNRLPHAHPWWSHSRMDHDTMLAVFDDRMRKNAPPDAPGAYVERVGDVVRQTGPDAAWNGVLWSALDRSRVDEAIAEQVDHYTALGREFEWKLYGHDQPDDLADRLEAAGFVPEEPETLMVARIADLPTSSAPPLASNCAR